MCGFFLGCVHNQFYDVKFTKLRFGCICEIEIVFGNCEYDFMFSPVFLAELFVTDSEYISSDNSRLDLHNFCTNAPENDSSLWYISSFLLSLLPLAPHQQRTNNHVYQNISYLSFSFWTLLPIVGILFSATPTFVNGNQIMLPKTNSSLLQIPLLPTVATDNILSKILSELRM